MLAAGQADPRRNHKTAAILVCLLYVFGSLWALDIQYLCYNGMWVGNGSLSHLSTLPNHGGNHIGPDSYHAAMNYVSTKI